MDRETMRHINESRVEPASDIVAMRAAHFEPVPMPNNVLPLPIGHEHDLSVSAEKIILGNGQDALYTTRLAYWQRTLELKRAELELAMSEDRWEDAQLFFNQAYRAKICLNELRFMFGE